MMILLKSCVKNGYWMFGELVNDPNFGICFNTKAWWKAAVLSNVWISQFLDMIALKGVMIWEVSS